jgi:hypothetical protein
VLIDGDRGDAGQIEGSAAAGREHRDDVRGLLDGGNRVRIMTV